MIYGIGIDIIRVDRMREAVGRWGERFLHKVFTEGEIAHCYRKRDPFPSLAVRFAAKEALIKALGSRFFPLTDIAVVNQEHGRPVLHLRGRVEGLFRDRGLCGPLLSLSHEKDYGIAFVVVEKEEKPPRLSAS